MCGRSFSGRHGELESPAIFRLKELVPVRAAKTEKRNNCGTKRSAMEKNRIDGQPMFGREGSSGDSAKCKH